MNTQNDTTRWSNDIFVESVRPLMVSLFEGRTLVGPADLRGLPAISIRTPAEFQWRDLIGVTVKNVDMAGSTINCAMSGAWLVDVCFSNSQFQECSMSRVRASHCAWSDATMTKPWLEDAQFESCVFTRTRVLGGRRSILPHDCGRRVSFTDCDFSKATFIGIGISGAVFRNCRFDDTVFDSCRIFNWRFEGSGPHSQQFNRCEYRGTNVGIRGQQE